MQLPCPLAVFQWIEFGPPKAEIQVRFLAAGPDTEITASHPTSKTRAPPGVAGFSLPPRISPRSIQRQYFVGTPAGTSEEPASRYLHREKDDEVERCVCAEGETPGLPDR